MAARLKNPLTVRDQPTIATGARLDELVDEAKRKFAYIMANFRFCRQFGGDSRHFNEALARIKAALAGSFDPVRDLQGLPASLFIVIQHHAQRHADGRGNFGDLTPCDMEAGARRAVELLRPYRGRPKDPVLQHHVEGLVAAMQEFSGLPVLATRTRDGVYSPQGSNALARALIESVRTVDPSVSQTQIVNLILAARTRQAGKNARFRHYFLTYGMRPKALQPIANN